MTDGEIGIFIMVISGFALGLLIGRLVIPKCKPDPKAEYHAFNVGIDAVRLQEDVEKRHPGNREKQAVYIGMITDTPTEKITKWFNFNPGKE